MNFNGRIMDGVVGRSFLSGWYQVSPKLWEKEGRELASGDRLRGQGRYTTRDEHFSRFGHNYLLLGGDNDRRWPAGLLSNTCRLLKTSSLSMMPHKRGWEGVDGATEFALCRGSSSHFEYLHRIQSYTFISLLRSLLRTQPHSHRTSCFSSENHCSEGNMA